MKVSEWRNGTALYYWFQDPVVGPPFKGPQIWVDLFNGFPILLIAVTWSVLVLEILIGMSWMWSQRARIILCSAGIIFHLSIIINHGLTSFFFTMTAVLIIIAFGKKQYTNKGTFL
jgi:antimicrobial peptide system SdpB family protein